MNQQELVLVIGASGMVGSNLVSELTKSGYRVRAATSRPSEVGTKNGVEKVLVNLVNGEGLHAAFEGVTRAFFLSPPGHSDQYALLSPLIQEAKRRALKKVVLMTALGANAVETSPFRRAELELEKSGLQYNIIRPNWFFQNFQTFWIHGIQQFGKILLPAGDANVGFIDARDISAVAAKLLTSDEFSNRDFDLTGPQSLNHAQVAEELSRVSGKSITYQEITSEDFLKGLLRAGLPNDYAVFLQTIMSFLKMGYSATTNDSVRTILGREPINLKTYADNNKSAWA